MNHDAPTPGRMPNHLAGQTSPYLLQHRYNPVDWYPWGPEALEKAKVEDKPIFLSIGYAACHWCHVMERETFEDERVAALLSADFVSIKVDREERPDIDDVYMTAVQLMTGEGGWPLNVFLTPRLEPFYGGTYFPPVDSRGRLGFATLLQKIRAAWADRRLDVSGTAEHLAGHVRALSAPRHARTGGAPVGRAEIERAAADLARRFDARWGGFGRAPKFPPHGAIRLLLREHARSGSPSALEMAATTLDRIALGGMYDQVGGGFARYSVDDRWLVPHFEKMLYDQALLVPAYLDAWLLTRRPLYRRVIEETLDFVRREMTDSSGGFWSSLDADSEGHEGTFYLFTPDEVRAVLGRADGDFFCEVYGIEPGGNFEGKSIPNLLGGSLRERAGAGPADEDDLAARLAPLRARLRAARQRRVRPGTDDKILTAWNGLMITACARAHQVLGREEDLASARRSADFVLGALMLDGRLLASHRDGTSRWNAYLDDHAFLARGLLDLYESCFDRRYLDAATTVARTLVHRFGDGIGGFFFTSDDHEELLARTRSVHDGALPAGSGVGAEVLLRLGVHRDDSELRRAGLAALSAYAPEVERAPSAFAALLAAADFAETAPVEVALVGPPGDPVMRALLAAVRGRYRPNLVVALSRDGAGAEDLPLLAGKKSLAGKPTAYPCRGYACGAPTTDPDVLAAALRR